MRPSHTLPILLAALLGALPLAQARQAVPAPAAPQAAQQAQPMGQPQQAVAPVDAAAAKQAEFERLLHAQVLLDRARFSPGEIDGAYGSNMRQALNTFQAARNLPVTGVLDEATWNALNTDRTPPLATHTLTDADVAGPFRPIPEDMMEKAKLPALGYASVLEGLGERFHASPALLERLNPGKNFGRAGEQIVVPNVGGLPPLPRAAKVVVRDKAKVLQLYDANGTLLAQYPASTGSDKDPLPLGTWKITGVHANPVYHYNPKLFWDSEPGDKKAKVQPGPNNPVGVVWIGLSKPHYGIHGTPVPGHVGKTESHGCIRLTNWSAADVAAAVAADVEVVLQE
ncbi:L,D-transpeptidase family protein [Massilia consociata]|uniref:L,D-transpeptidase family protein n=1 Tax=Massilia consociata TaxID=760117 RepID=A0ABV6FG68_9BURK